MTPYVVLHYFSTSTPLGAVASFIAMTEPTTGKVITVSAHTPDAALSAAKALFPLRSNFLAVQPEETWYVPPPSNSRRFPSRVF